MELFKLFGTIALDNSNANRALDDTTRKTESSQRRISTAMALVLNDNKKTFSGVEITTFGQKVAEITSRIVSNLSAGWENIKNTVTTKVSTMVTTVQGKFESLRTAVAAKVESLRSTAVAKFESIRSGIGARVESIRSTTVAKFESMRTTVAAKFESMRSTTAAKVESLRSTAAGKFESVRSTIAAKMSSAQAAVGNAISAMRQKFRFSWSLPNLKLPHITITGSFKLNPPSVPRFSISWYKKAMENAMLLKSPTIFGQMGGNLLGGGEAGEEVVSGSGTLMRMIRENIESCVGNQIREMNTEISRMTRLMEEYLPRWGELKVVMDSGVMVGQLAPAMDAALGERYRRKGRGM